MPPNTASLYAVLISLLLAAMGSGYSAGLGASVSAWISTCGSTPWRCIGFVCARAAAAGWCCRRCRADLARLGRRTFWSCWTHRARTRKFSLSGRISLLNIGPIYSNYLPDFHKRGIWFCSSWKWSSDAWSLSTPVSLILTSDSRKRPRPSLWAHTWCKWPWKPVSLKIMFAGLRLSNCLESQMPASCSIDAFSIDALLRSRWCQLHWSSLILLLIGWCLVCFGFSSCWSSAGCLSFHRSTCWRPISAGGIAPFDIEHSIGPHTNPGPYQMIKYSSVPHHLSIWPSNLLGVLDFWIVSSYSEPYVHAYTALT